MKKFVRFLLLMSGVCLSAAGCPAGGLDNGPMDLAVPKDNVQDAGIWLEPDAEAPVGETADGPAGISMELEEPADEELVPVLDYVPSLYVDLKYATEDNFTNTVIYGFTDASLRYGTIKKLAEVQAELLQKGYSLKVWDAYRPLSAQFKLWEVCPDSTYVANPNTGCSSHNKGSAVDVTLVMADGTQIEMPSGFDDFSGRAGRDYSGIPEEAAKNAMILEDAMLSHGFVGYSAEWWHYADSEAYPVVEG